MTLALIDYGANNVTSVERAFQRLGADTTRANEGANLADAKAIVLPGVGHFAALIRAMDERGFRAPLLGALARGVPFLGICLGLQSLFASSEESPLLPGLGILPGRVSALPSTMKVPHMGWNQLKIARVSRLLRRVDTDEFFYFAHSFAVTETNGACVACCEYGVEFAAVLEHENIYAVQFHPEKSGDAGARVLRNFLEIAQGQ